MSYAPTGYDGSAVGVKTLVETPAAVFAGATQIVGRSRLRITNMSTDTRARIGTQTADLQRDGHPIEPGDSLTLYPTDTVYACSEGAAITAQIEEK